jgi:hypothetical protein
MADGANASGAGQLFATQSILGVPELDPVVLQRLGKRDFHSARRRAMAKLELGQNLLNGGGLERLLEHRQHRQLHLLAGLFDVVEDGGAAAAHELHGAGKAGFGQRLDRGDCVLHLEIDVEENYVGQPRDRRAAERGAIDEFDGIDAAALQDERDELPDAAFFVNDEGKRAPAHTRGCGGIGLGCGGGC